MAQLKKATRSYRVMQNVHSKTKLSSRPVGPWASGTSSPAAGGKDDKLELPRTLHVILTLVGEIRISMITFLSSFIESK